MGQVCDTIAIGCYDESSMHALYSVPLEYAMIADDVTEYMLFCALT